MFLSTNGHEIPLVCEPKCRFCSKPVPDAYALWEQCSDCTNRLREKGRSGYGWGPYSFVRAAAAGFYIPDISEKGTMGKMIIEMKNGKGHSEEIAEAMVYVLRNEFQNEVFDLIVPVPHIHREN